MKLNIDHNLSHFIKNYGSPFFVGSLVTKKVVFVNTVAEKLFGVQAETCDFSTIFAKSEQRIEAVLQKSLHPEHTTLIYNFIAVTAKKEEIVVDLQVGFFNDDKTEVFLEVIPQRDTRMEMALHQVEYSTRAEGILNFDEKLTIVDCNEAMLEVFDANEELRHSHFGNQFINGFFPEVREKLLQDIFTQLKKRKTYSKKVQVFTATGEERWYQMDLDCRTLDNSGVDKIMVLMTNIEKQVELEEEHSQLNQYLEAFQSVSGESFCIIDLKEKTLTQSGVVARELGVEGILQNFPDCTYHFIHPDDLPNFKAFSEKSMHGSSLQVETRMKNIHGEYQWYEISSQGISRDDGEVTELVGKISNIHKSKMAEDEFSAMNKYFEALQTFSNDVLYRIDVKTMTLYHSFQSNRGKLMGNVIPDYLNTLVTEVVHPDDVESYLRGNEAWMLDETVEIEIRFALITDEYEWYRVKGKKILDDSGNLVEVVGVLSNIQKEKTMETEVSLLTQYFETMQSLSSESIYVFDLETRLLHIGGLTETELGLPLEVEGYPESLFDLTHAEDLDKFKRFAGRTLNSKEGRVELRFRNLDGSFKWYELISNVIYGKENVPTKILGKIRNIEKEKNIQEEVSSMTKYFNVMQEFCADILYRIDVPTQTLYHAYQSDRALRIGMVVPNYIETLVKEKIVHPDDAEEYIRNSKAWLEDDSLDCELRFSIITEKYEWYSVKRRKIYDDEGNLVEILGALVSVQKERELAKSNQYFKIMQELSEDILYRVDVETMTLHHNFESSQEITKRKEIPDYINTFIQEKVVHPDDVEQYLKDLEAFHHGDLTDISVRFALMSEEYHWYKARARKIYDDDGNVVEFWGRLMSEQKVKEAQLELNAVSQQFNAMQNLSSDILFHI